jgi:uncharacterized zinc-type alcohol dehydrogenase-like protein
MATYQEVAWGVLERGQKDVVPMHISRGACGDDHVKFDLLYSGICHTDVHFGRGHFPHSSFPCVPGHELLGKVTEVGKNVTKFKIGDIVGVGCIVDSCLECTQCANHDENYCMKGMTGTYNGDRKHGRVPAVPGDEGKPTYGGYTGSNVVHQHFVMKIPEGLPIEKAAPILCAGITMYDPLRHWGATQGKKMTIGIVGIGGLGTMGVKLSRALGHDVVAISSTAEKESLAKEKGATHFCCSKSEDSLKAHAGMCDLILNTVSANHNINTYIPLLAKSGTIVQLGAVMTPHPISQFPLMMNRQSVAGSLIGGIKATEECLELCAKHGITPDCQTITASQINWAWDQLDGDGGNKDGIRYVIDVQASLKDESFVPKQ